MKILPSLIALGLAAAPAWALAMEPGEGASEAGAGAASGLSAQAALEAAALAPDAHPSLAVQIAQQYEKQGDRRRAAEWYRRASLAGHTGAQLKVADMLLTSAVSTRLPPHQRERAAAQAVALLKHAANAGNADAALRLHTLYQHGEAVPADAEQASRYLRLAADAGHPAAAFDIAMQLRLAGSADRDPEGQRYLKAAATAGHPRAIRQLVEEELVRNPPDVESAVRWAERARDPDRTALLQEVAAARAVEEERRASEAAIASANVAPTAEKSTSQLTTPASALPLADAGNAALSVEVTQAAPPAAPEADLATVMAELQALRAQLETSEDRISALQQQLTDRDAQIAALRAEAATRQRAEEAAAIAREAARKNESGLAALKAGDFVAAHSRFKAAADAGNGQALNNLATLYLRGQGVPKSIEQAIEYFAAGAQAGNAQAAANLGSLYARGLEGVRPDSALATQWFQRAHALGHVRAAEYLRARGATPATERVAAN